MARLEDDDWTWTDGDQSMGYGSISQLTTDRITKLPKKHPIGFDTTVKGTKHMRKISETAVDVRKIVPSVPYLARETEEERQGRLALAGQEGAMAEALEKRQAAAPTNADLAFLLTQIAHEARDEALSAASKWPPMNSAHEAYAVLLEEVDELWDHVKVNQKKRDLPAMRQECIQVAAMALRFALDICDCGRGRK